MTLNVVYIHPVWPCLPFKEIHPEIIYVLTSFAIPRCPSDSDNAIYDKDFGLTADSAVLQSQLWETVSRNVLPSHFAIVPQQL